MYSSRQKSVFVPQAVCQIGNIYTQVWVHPGNVLMRLVVLFQLSCYPGYFWQSLSKYVDV